MSKARVEKPAENKSVLSMAYFAKTVFFSSFVSIFCLAMTHPLDTVRVRMQTQKVGQNISMLRTFGKTYRGEGIVGFYKGLASPLIGSLPYNTSVFTISELVKQ